jgi:hypothetical protein
MVRSKSIPIRLHRCNRRLHERLLTLLTRASAMGCMAGATVTQIDAHAVQRVLTALHKQGLIGAAPVALAPLLKKGPAQLDAATASAWPTAWSNSSRCSTNRLRRPRVGADARGVRRRRAGRPARHRAGSLRRYAARNEPRRSPTPSACIGWRWWCRTSAARTTTSACVAGSNGRARNSAARARVRRARRAWTPEDEAVQRVRTLAAALSGAPRLAA